MEKLVVITGTNASGKSGLGIELAGMYGGEVISADSSQVFKGLDLGSGKVTKEEMQGVPHHLIDVAMPNDFFSLKDFQSKAYEAVDDVIKRGRIPFLVGGTGLYVNSVVDGYNLNGEKPDPKIREEVLNLSIDEIKERLRRLNPAALERVDLNNKRRLERALERALTGNGDELESVKKYDTLVVGVTWERKVLYERIRERLDKRLSEGMIDEVKRLREEGATDDFLYRLGLEYRYILMYLRGEFESYEAFYDKLFTEIRHLAKEQMTWFRKRKDIVWIDMADDPVKRSKALIDEFLKK